MSTLRVLVALAIAALFLSTVPAQVLLDHSVTLDDGDPGSFDYAFGIAMAPDGVHAVVPICGTLGQNNADVALIDVIAGTQITHSPSGLFPEDPAITLDAQGAARHVYVTNSSGGSVSCYDAQLQPVATIPIPDCSGFPLPYGLLVSPDQTRVIVTSISFCSDVHVIDSDPASATFNTVLSTFQVWGVSGRATWWNYPVMAVPTATYDAGFTLSRGGFAVVDVTNPTAASYHVITPAAPFHYTATNEAVVIPGGRVLLAIYDQVFPIVHECDLATGAVLRTLDLNTVAGVNLHGLTVNPDKTLAVVTSINGGQSVFIDLATFTVAGVYNHGSGSNPNDVVFTPDGSRAVVTLQAAPRVDVLKRVPGYGLALAAPGSVNLGANLTYDLSHVESGQYCAIYYSLTGSGPQLIDGFVVYLSNPFALAHEAAGDLHGRNSVTFVVPSTTGLSGLTISTQAVTLDRDGSYRVSNGAQTLIN
jgi:DNA-binding beta-propeller fold protein YncE